MVSVSFHLSIDSDQLSFPNKEAAVDNLFASFSIRDQACLNALANP